MWFAINLRTDAYRQVVFNWFRPDGALSNYATAFNAAGSPPLVGGYFERLSTVNYRGRAYGCGGLSDNWLIDENFRVHRLGMDPPLAPPSVTAGAGAIAQICYWSFYDEQTGERSSLSAGTSLTGSVTRTWTSIPDEEVGALSHTINGTTVANATTAIVGLNSHFSLLRIGDRIALSSAPTVYAIIRSITDDTHLTVDRNLGNGTSQTIVGKFYQRASHVELWVSVAGALPRLAMRVQTGSASVVESTATLALGEAFVTSFERFPRCTFNAIYHDRLAMAGDERAPDTVYLSGVFTPERSEGLSFKTRNGETITGLAVSRDSLLVFTPFNTYAIQGYSEDDMVMSLVDTDIGCTNHWGVQVIYGNAWVPNDQGIFLWNGAYHQLLGARLSEWKADYKANRRIFEEAISFNNPDDYTYSFVVRPTDLAGTGTDNYSSSIGPKTASGVSFELHGLGLANAWTSVSPNPNVYVANTVAWTATYLESEPELAGGFQAPYWGFDVMGRVIRCASLLMVPTSTRRVLYLGFDDGHVRSWDPTNTDDNGDVYQKRFYLRTNHSFFGDPGGSPEDGKDFVELWTYVRSEDTAWRLFAIGGEDEAWYVLGILPDNRIAFWRDDVAASKVATSGPILDESTNTVLTTGNRTFTPESIHYHLPQKVFGNGLTIAVEAFAPNNIDFRGFGGKYGPGPNKHRAFYTTPGG